MGVWSTRGENGARGDLLWPEKGLTEPRYRSAAKTRLRAGPEIMGRDEKAEWQMEGARRVGGAETSRQSRAQLINPRRRGGPR